MDHQIITAYYAHRRAISVLDDFVSGTNTAKVLLFVVIVNVDVAFQMPISFNFFAVTRGIHESSEFTSLTKNANVT